MNKKKKLLILALLAAGLHIWGMNDSVDQLAIDLHRDIYNVPVGDVNSDEESDSLDALMDESDQETNPNIDKTLRELRAERYDSQADLVEMTHQRDFLNERLSIQLSEFFKKNEFGLDENLSVQEIVDYLHGIILENREEVAEIKKKEHFLLSQISRLKQIPELKVRIDKLNKSIESEKETLRRKGATVGELAPFAFDINN